jgi:hypothetical protein
MDRVITMREKRNAYKILVWKHETDQLENLGVDGTIKLNRTLAE